MRRLIPVLCVFILMGPAHASDKLTEAFILKCEHLMGCMIDKAAADLENSDQLNFLKAQTTLQCQAQAGQLGRPAPESVDKVIGCLETMAEMSCDDITAGKIPATCQAMNI